MPTEIFEGENIFAPAFKLDADLVWTEVDEFELPARKIESKGTVNDYIAQGKPLQANVEGIVTAMTVDPDLPEADKLNNAKDRLQVLARKREIVLVLSELYAGYLGISRVEIVKGVDDGHSLQARIAFGLIETTVTATAQIPASKLRAKVKRVAATGKKGGAAKPSTPTDASKSVLLKVADKATGLLGRLF